MEIEFAEDEDGSPEMKMGLQEMGSSECWNGVQFEI